MHCPEGGLHGVSAQDKGGELQAWRPCLTLQIERAQEIKKTFVQNAAREGTDARKAAEKAASGVIVNLGLVHD